MGDMFYKPFREAMQALLMAGDGSLDIRRVKTGGGGGLQIYRDDIPVGMPVDGYITGCVIHTGRFYREVIESLRNSGVVSESGYEKATMILTKAACEISRR